MFCSVVLRALFYFLPAYAANAAPVLLAKLKILESLKVPVDFGKQLNGEDLFGRTKTWRGILGGIVFAEIVILIEYWLITTYTFFGEFYLFTPSLKEVIILGLLFGIGEGFGDVFKSFFKRRLHIKSSKPFFPFDQMSFLGALFLSFIVYVPDFGVILSIVIISPLIPVISNLVAYKLGLKKVWW
ncbi:CDP-archaeol synthase [Pseudomonadota bacterium]